MFSKKTIFDKDIRISKRQEINLSTFGYLFSQIIQYHSQKKRNVEQELIKMGQSIGVRMFELIYCREKKLKKEIKYIEILQFISNTVWKTLFGKVADGVTTVEDQQYSYLIKDSNPLILKYISEDERMGGAALVVGIIKGILDSTGFDAEVCYQTMELYDEKNNDKTISLYPSTHFFIKFEQWVVEREK